MMNTSDFQARLLDELSVEEVERVFPLIEQQLVDAKQQVKNEAISLVRGFFPDPHDGGDGCSDCLIIDSLAETLAVYLSTKIYSDE